MISLQVDVSAFITGYVIETCMEELSSGQDVLNTFTTVRFNGI